MHCLDANSHEREMWVSLDASVDRVLSGFIHWAHHLQIFNKYNPRDKKQNKTKRF